MPTDERPDPARLTDRALDRAREDMRREILSVSALANERWASHQQVHKEQLEALAAAAAALRSRLEQAEEYRKSLHQQDLDAGHRALDELKRITEKRFDQVDEWHSAMSDQMRDYPTRAENRNSMEALAISVAGLSDKLQTHITAMAQLSGDWVTKEQLDAQERQRENDRRETRRAFNSAMIGVSIALVGWIITLVLFLLQHVK